ncbi:prolipoprotein diacylglyceryl transferase [Candidatus Poribacteria bacterium]
MLPVILRIGPLSIYSYGLMMALGFLVAGFFLKRELKRAGLPVDMGDLIVIAAVLGGVIGAKLYSIMESLNDPNALSLRSIFSGSGLVWYGGFIGGTLAVLAVIRLKRASILEVLDLLAPLLILGYAFGRMGCFLSGDGDYGPPTDLPWGMAFPNGTVPTLERVHPTPLYEILILSVMFAFLWKIRKRSTPKGWNFGLYLILGGVERFITEFWRLTSVVALGMTMAQIIGIISIAVGAALMLYPRKSEAPESQ